MTDFESLVTLTFINGNDWEDVCLCTFDVQELQHLVGKDTKIRMYTTANYSGEIETWETTFMGTSLIIVTADA